MEMSYRKGLWRGGTINMSNRFPNGIGTWVWKMYENMGMGVYDEYRFMGMGGGGLEESG